MNQIEITKKLQPKIFFNVTVDLTSGYSEADGYSVGQVIHFNDTGFEYVHVDTDSNWKLVNLWDENMTSSAVVRHYGMLYNGYAVATNMLAPVGWHVPSANELYNLLSAVGYDAAALRETGTTHWDNSNNATNSSHFSARGGGARRTWYHDYAGLKTNAQFWGYSPSYPLNQTYIYLSLNSVYVSSTSMTEGLSVRCVRDSGNTSTTAVDYDGNVYQSVTIGGETWLTENLFTTHYNNGAPILSDWTNGAGAFSPYDNILSNVESNVAVIDSTHLIPKNNKKIYASSIDGLPTEVFIGTTAPTDPNTILWIDTSGTPAP